MKSPSIAPTFISSTIALLVTIAITTPQLFAQEKDETEQAKWKRALTNKASKYTIVVEGSDQPLVFQKEPVMVWVNPVRESQLGVIHVWTANGRPRVFGTIFTLKDEKQNLRRIIHEFHSLAPSGLTATYASQGVVWKPKMAGINFREMPSAPVPATTRNARLVQMRQMVREFTGNSINYSRVRQELRLLPQPTFRYDVGEDVHDGAVFSMISPDGTDPEILLSLEVIDTKEGPRWHYAASRFSDLTLSLELKGERVWELVFPPGVQQSRWMASEDDYFRVFSENTIPEASVESFLSGIEEK